MEETSNAPFNLAIDIKLRARDLANVRVSDVMHRGFAMPRASVTQQKTSQLVRFEIREHARDSLAGWVSNR
jgi:hypothetical protein